MGNLISDTGIFQHLTQNFVQSFILCHDIDSGHLFDILNTIEKKHFAFLFKCP